MVEEQKLAASGGGMGEALKYHPDGEYKEYLLAGLGRGFRIGFDYGSHRCRSAKTNMKSALQNPAVVDRYLATEVGLGRILGPLEPSSLPLVVINKFGVIPKSHQPGRWRLIVDLSHPNGWSVNDGIQPELCSLSYTSVDEALRLILPLGPGTQLAKFDIESAYRLVMVHPDDRHLLGMKWKDQLFVDTVPPFGLRSAPKVFTALADALQWILGQNRVPRGIHYLDDFLLVGAPASQECQQALKVALQVCQQLGVPIAAHKTEGPGTLLVFLGIEIDTRAMEVRLPTEKLHRLQQEIEKWQYRRACTKRELLSLIGQLQHACCVVRPGRSFLRRMISLSSTVKEPHYRVRLNREFRSDLQWWACFLPTWNGRSMMTGILPTFHAGVLTSDASGSWGCGAFTSSGVVPGEIPGLLEHGPYHCEGTSPGDNRCSAVGSSMAGQYCSGMLRQCSGGSYCEVWPEQE